MTMLTRPQLINKHLNGKLYRNLWREYKHDEKLGRAFLYDEDKFLAWAKERGLVYDPDLIDTQAVADLLKVDYKTLLNVWKYTPHMPQPAIKGVGRSRQLFSKTAITELIDKIDIHTGIENYNANKRSKHKHIDVSRLDFNAMAVSFNVAARRATIRNVG